MPKPKDAKQQACAPSSLILACYFAPVRQALGFQGSFVKYLILVLISILSFSVKSSPVGDCIGTPKEAVTALPSPLDNWGQIVCTPYGHIISNKQGYIWSNVGSYSPVMIPSQMVRSNPKSLGNNSYFTSIEMNLLKDEEAAASIELFETGFDKSPNRPKVYSLLVNLTRRE